MKRPALASICIVFAPAAMQGAMPSPALPAMGAGNAVPELGQEALARRARASRSAQKAEVRAAKILQKSMAGGNFHRTALAQPQGGGASQKAAAQQETALLAAARGLRLKGLYPAAADAYRDFIREYPKSSRLFEARFWRARSLFASEKWDAAADAFTEFLNSHSDQRTYSQQAKEDRIHCWNMRYRQSSKAAPGLFEALRDPDEDIRILAALALAENQNASGRNALEQGLGHAKFGEQCGLGLWKLGLRGQPKPKDEPAPLARMIVVKVKTKGDNFVVKIPVRLISGIEKMLPAEAKKQMAENGISDISELAQLAASATKGQVLFDFEDKKEKITVVITVE